jgi:hypothetical protein
MRSSLHSLIDDLLDVACDNPDADACARLAAVFRSLAAQVQREIAAGSHPESLGTEDLLRDLQRGVRSIAEAHGVPLPWLPMAPERASHHQQIFRMFAGLVEGLDYLARRPELKRPDRGSQ